MAERILQTLRFGSYDAEDDPHLLDIFIEYDGYALLSRDDTLIILGAKGIGKTALALRLLRSLRHAFLVKADDMDLEGVFETLAQIHEEHAIDSRALITAWRHLFVVLGMDWICTQEETMLKDGACARDLKKVRQYLRGLLKGKVGRAHKNIGYTLRRILQVLHEHLTAQSARKLPIDEELLSTYPTRDEAAKQATDATQRIFEASDSDLLVVVDGFDRFLDGKMGQPYDIDAHASLLELLIALLYGVRDLAVKSEFAGRILPKVMYPTDKFPTAHRDFAKIDEFTQEIHWSEEELFAFVCKRIAVDLNIKSGTGFVFDPAQTWSRVFRGFITPAAGMAQQPEQRTFEYILRHTHSRPRDFLVLCRSIVEAVSGKRVLTDAIVEEGVREGTRKRFTFFLNEYAKEYPFIKDVIQTFKGSASIFAYDDSASKRFRSALGIIKSYWPQPPYNVVIDEKYVLTLLAKVGFLGRFISGESIRKGFRRTHGKKYASEFSYLLRRPLTLQPGERLCIHPMFYAELDIEPDSDYIVGPVSLRG